MGFKLMAIAAVALVLSTAACGGGGSNTTTSTPADGTSTAQWANGVCSAFTAWKSSLETVKKDFASNPSESQLRQAGRDIDRATKTLTKS